MIKDILEFFKREKIYGILFVALVVIYAFFIFKSGQVEESKKDDTKIIDQFKKAEDKAESKIKDLGSLDAYLKDRPDLRLGANALTAFFGLALLFGLWFDYKMIAKPGYRVGLQVDRPLPHLDWKFSLLFKFFIWFFTINVGLSLVLSAGQRVSGGDENFFILFHTTCAEIVSFIVIYFLVRRNGGRVSDFGLWVSEGKWFREIRLGWAAYCAVLPLFGVVLLILLGITEIFHYEPPPHPLVPIFLEGEHSKGLMIYSITLAVFFGPIFEEIFFRGFCYPIFKKRFGSVAAMVVTSSFFAFIHDSTFAFWPIFILGLGLNYIYEKRGSLLANITLHVTHNALFLAYFFLAKSIVGREMGG